MKCPFCGAEDTQVIDSRVSDDGDSIRRRRKCAACNKRFTTYETVELRMPQVVKQDGSRAEFDLEEVDIDGDEQLRQRYNDEVPVIAINRTKAFKYRVELREFLKKLAARS